MIDTERERETETQAEGEAGSMQGAWRGTWSRVSRITPWAEDGAKPLSHPGCPNIFYLVAFDILVLIFLGQVNLLIATIDFLL